MKALFTTQKLNGDAVFRPQIYTTPTVVLPARLVINLISRGKVRICNGKLLLTTYPA